TGTTDTTGGMDVCDPDLLDLPCLECIKASCCTQIVACLGDAACSCAYDCVTMGGDPVQCQSDCNAVNGVTNALLFCGQLNCANDCTPP
ncbi:MAG: hypothetical protein KC431_12595, partial [Myxococcales bacterium]|nr:hypothetical protein [Myxococcales bacterium]